MSEESPVRIEQQCPWERAIVERFCLFCALPTTDEPPNPKPADPGVVERVVSRAGRGEPVPGVYVSVEERRAALTGGWETGRLRFDTEEARTRTGELGWYGLCARPVGGWDDRRFHTFRLRVRSAEGDELFARAVFPQPP